jgi:hypothetical protein
MPDVQMNKGPLPSTAGGPAGSDGTPDGRYNFNSELLSGIDAYSYAESARMGSDKAYQQIPHRLQKIIPLLHVPDGKKGKQKLPISHAVDQGDIAFALALEPKRMPGVFYEKSNRGSFQVQNLSMLTPFCNFVTVNYLLAGLQIYHKHVNLAEKDINDAWYRLWEALDPHWESHKDDPNYLHDNNYQNLKMLVRKFIPFGICAGSEHQGGKHELSYMPVQAAVNHVTTMTIDGQSRDLVNYWRDHNLDAGDQLGFHLEKIQISNTYTLNHYYKSYATANIEDVKECWQLVPSKLYPCTSDRYNADRLSPWEHGWWRVGQMMHFRGKHGSTDCKDICSNDMIYLKGGLLQVTFAPVWHDYSRGTSGAPSVLSTPSTSAYAPRPPSAGGSSSSSKPGTGGSGTTGGAGSGGGPTPAPPGGTGLGPPTGTGTGGGGGPSLTTQKFGITTQINWRGETYPLFSENAIINGGSVLCCVKESDEYVYIYKITSDKVVMFKFKTDNLNSAVDASETPMKDVMGTTLAHMKLNNMRFIDFCILQQEDDTNKKYLLLEPAKTEELPAFDAQGTLHIFTHKIQKDPATKTYQIIRRNDKRVINGKIPRFPVPMDGFNLHWNGILFIPGSTPGKNYYLDLNAPGKERSEIGKQSDIVGPGQPSDPDTPEYSIFGLFWNDSSFFEWNSRSYVEANASRSRKTPPTDNSSITVHNKWKISKDTVSLGDHYVFSLRGELYPLTRNNVLVFSNGHSFRKKSSTYPNDYEFCEASGGAKSLNRVYHFDGCDIGVNYRTEWIVRETHHGSVVYASNTPVSDIEGQEFLIKNSGNSVFGNPEIPWNFEFNDEKKRIVFMDGSYIERTNSPPAANGSRMHTYYGRDNKVISVPGTMQVGGMKIHPTIPAHNDISFVIEKTSSPGAFATADGDIIEEATFNLYTTPVPTPTPVPPTPAPAPAPPALTTSTVSTENTDKDPRLDKIFMRDDWWKHLPEKGQGDNRWTIELDPSNTKKIISASKIYTVVKEGTSKKYKVTLAYFIKDAPESRNESNIVKITDEEDNSDKTEEFIYIVDYSVFPTKSQLLYRSEFALSQLESFLDQTKIEEPEPEIINNLLVNGEAGRSNTKQSRLYFRLEVEAGNAERRRTGYFAVNVYVLQQYSPYKPSRSKPILKMMKLTGFYKDQEDGTEIKDFRDNLMKGFGGAPWSFNTDGTLHVQNLDKPLQPDSLSWFTAHFKWTLRTDFETAYNRLDQWEETTGPKALVGQAFDPESDMEIDYTDPAPMPPVNLLDKARSMFGGKQDPKAAAKRAAAEELTTKKAPGKRKISVVRDD